MRILRILWTRIRPIEAQPGEPTKKTTVVGALFGKYLLATNIVSSGVLMSIGDWMSQEIEYRDGTPTKRFDWTRNAKMFVVGAAQGPLHHYFYGWLDRTYFGATIKITIIKILYDQLIMSPVCIAAFFYSAGWLDGKNTSECTDEFQSKFKRVYITDWIVWPATQFINFYYLPPKYRVIYVNFITMLYNVFLSYIKHEDAVESSTTEPTKNNIITSVKCFSEAYEGRDDMKYVDETIRAKIPQLAASCDRIYKDSKFEIKALPTKGRSEDDVKVSLDSIFARHHADQQPTKKEN